MRRLFGALCITGFVFSTTGIATATSFYDYVKDRNPISTSGTAPAAWYKLGLPNWYNPAYVTFFNITLVGFGDNSHWPIHIFLDFDDDKTLYAPVGSYDVDENRWFSLALDILHGDLLYNGTDVGDLPSNVSLASFLGPDHFWVGYGCDFTHFASIDYIKQDPVPEPATILLLASGLIGIGGFRRRFRIGVKRNPIKPVTP